MLVKRFNIFRNCNRMFPEDGLLYEERDQLDATQYFIELMIRSTCFGHNYVRHQELETVQISSTMD